MVTKYNRRTRSESLSLMVMLLIFLMAFWWVAAWATHIAVCLKTAAWGFLIAGALVLPIGIVHGTGIWFGWF